MNSNQVFACLQICQLKRLPLHHELTLLQIGPQHLVLLLEVSLQRRPDDLALDLLDFAVRPHPAIDDELQVKLVGHLPAAGFELLLEKVVEETVVNLSFDYSGPQLVCVLLHAVLHQSETAIVEQDFQRPLEQTALVKSVQKFSVRNLHAFFVMLLCPHQEEALKSDPPVQLVNLRLFQGQPSAPNDVVFEGLHRCREQTLLLDSVNKLDFIFLFNSHFHVPLQGFEAFGLKAELVEVVAVLDSDSLLNPFKPM